jgi:predicted permease
VTETFRVTLEQMSMFFIFMAAGYILKKGSLLPDSAGNVLSRLELYIFLPAMCFNTFSSNLKIDVLASKLPLLGWSLLLLAAAFGLSIPLSMLFSRERMTRAVYSYAFTVPNLGYLGYPLVGAVFGQEALLDFMIFTLPFNLFIYTVGIYILNPARVFNFKKILNPIIISIAAGTLVGLSGFNMPSFAVNTLSAASGCTGPIAMLLTGFVLARSPLREMLSNYKMYIAAAVRLIFLPLFFGFLMYLAGIDRYIIKIACALLVLPMGLNNVVFPEAFGGDSKTGAQSCFVSNIMGVITVPFAYMLLTALFG